MRLVIDTNIVVSGTLWSGTPARLLDAVKIGRATLATSAILLAELEDVLGRAKLATRIALIGTTPSDLLAAYARQCALVTPAPLCQLAPDPDDDWVIATAVAARADMIVTGDKPFLTLKEVDGIRIGTVADALAEISTGPQLTIRKL